LMPLYRTAEIAERAGVPITTLWRRVTRLAAQGEFERVVRIGGAGGTFGGVRFPGSLDDLAEKLKRPQPPKGPHTCPTCGSSNVPPTGPPCAECGTPTEVRGPKCAWCVKCHRGWLIERGPSQRLPLRSPKTALVG